VYLRKGTPCWTPRASTCPARARRRTVELEYLPRREGLHRYRVWTPARPGEISSTNNERLLVVRVLKEKIGVLLIAGRPSFELRFVKRALESDVSLDVETVVLSLKEFPAGSVARGRSSRHRSRNSRRATWSCLLDCDAGSLGARAGDLVRFVRERGGALLVMGPPSAFDLGSSPLAGILPVQPARGRPRTGKILPVLTDIGRRTRSPAGAGAEQNVRRWSELPPLDACRSSERRARTRASSSPAAWTACSARSSPLVATCQGGSPAACSAIGRRSYWRWDHYLWGTGRRGMRCGACSRAPFGGSWRARDFRPVLVRPSKNLFEGRRRW